MITIFAIPKSFHDKHIKIIQTNAIKSWANLDVKKEIYLLGDDFGVAEIARKLGVFHIGAIEKNEYGTPLLSSAFLEVSKKSKYDNLFYLNSDIIVLSEINNILNFIESKKKFLIAGQRWDLEINKEIDFGDSRWKLNIENEIKKRGSLHKPSGSDYFIFNKCDYLNIPRFAVGRVAWDTWMIQYALEKGFETIDATSILKIVHQNHDYNHQVNKGLDKFNSAEGKKNIELTNPKNGFATIKDLKYFLTTNLKLKKKFVLFEKIKIYFKNNFYKIKKIIKLQLLKKQLKFKLFLLRILKKDIKIIIGASNIKQNGWVITEKSNLDVLDDDNWNFLFKKKSISAIVAEHVFEHLDENEGAHSFKICFEYLRKGGYLRIAVPDGCCPDVNYINRVKPGGWGDGSWDHKILYNYELLTQMLEKSGFSVSLLEYFDKNGTFHAEPWKKEDGLIRRSLRNDKRNKNNKIKYTSLIVDAIKK